MKPTESQNHAEFLRRMYAANVVRHRKMITISRLLAIYAIVLVILIAISLH